MRLKAVLALLIIVASELTMIGVALYETAPTEIRLAVTFDPNIYVWDSPLPDPWIANVKLTSGLTVDDLDLSSFLLEGLFPPIDIYQDSKTLISLYLDPLDMYACLSIQRTHLRLFGNHFNAELDIWAQTKDGINCRDCGLVLIVSKRF